METNIGDLALSLLKPSDVERSFEVKIKKLFVHLRRSQLDIIGRMGCPLVLRRADDFSDPGHLVAVGWVFGWVCSLGSDFGTYVYNTLINNK